MQKIKKGRCLDVALTPKQQAFCRHVAAGKSYKDAYLNAYDCTSNTTAYREGGKLALRPEIQENIKTLQKPLQEAAKLQGLNARQSQIDYIKSRIAICEKKEDEGSIIRYTEQLNKLYGLYGMQEEEQKQSSPVQSLDTEALKKLTKIG